MGHIKGVAIGFANVRLQTLGSQALGSQTLDLARKACQEQTLKLITNICQLRLLKSFVTIGPCVIVTKRCFFVMGGKIS